MLQKYFTQDYLSGKKAKNTGQKARLYIDVPQGLRKEGRHVRDLMNCNPDLEEALEILMHADVEAEFIDEILSAEMYAPFSLEEVILAFSQAVWLYMPMAEFLPRIYKEVCVK